MTINNNVVECVFFICLTIILLFAFALTPSNNDVKIQCYEAAKVNQNFKPSDCEVKDK